MNAPQRVLWSDVYPELGKDPIPVEKCLSPDHYQKEIDAVFKKTWLKVGRVEEVPMVGDYKIKPLLFTATEVLIVRDRDGQIKGFYNTCSHRGNKVIWGGEGCGKARGNGLICRFHGWVYGLDGTLLQVPEEELFFDLNKSENGLTPIATSIWQGFIFINLDPNPKHSLPEFLAGMYDRYEGFPFHEMTASYRYRTILNTNWKIAQDAFSEAYHVTTIHAGSFPGAFSASLVDVGFSGPHRWAGIQSVQAREFKPVADLAYKLATTSIAKPGARRKLPPKINPNKLPDFGFDLAVIFPNFLVHVMDDLYFTHQFWPMGVGKTLWEGIQYFYPAKNAGERFAQEYGQVLQRNAWLEDTATMEDTYEALLSGAKKVMHFQDGEILLRHAYKVIDEWIEANA